MGPQRRTADEILFALAFGSICALGLGFAASRNGAAALMALIVLGGLVAGRVVGVPGRTLLLLALGLVAILWIAWVDPPGDGRRTSALAHFAAGALAGWALAATLAARVRWPAWALFAVAALPAITIGWELAEYVGDQIFDTALAASATDSALDVLFGCFGGTAGVALAALSPARRRG